MKDKFYFLFSLAMLFATFGFGQSPYEVNWKKESIIFGSAIGMFGVAKYMDAKSVRPLTNEDVFGFDRANINSFDRKATYYLSSTAGNASDYIEMSSYALPLLLGLNKSPRKDFGKLLVLYGETILLTSGLTRVVKRVALRPRPFVYNELASLKDKTTKGARYSFFSGHTSTATANCFFAAKVFSDYFPDSKWKPLVWSGAILTSASVGYLRVRAGKHYLTDVIGGFVVGGAIGYLIPHLHKSKTAKKVSLTPLGSGFLFSYQF